MAYKTLLFGTDDLFNALQPYYLQAVQRGILEIVAAAVLENGNVHFVTPDGKQGRGYNSIDVDIAIISSKNDFYNRMKFLEAQGIPRDRIIDGRIFIVPNLDFTRLLREGVAYGILNDQNSFAVCSYVTYPQMFSFQNGNSTLFLDKKSYISKNATIERYGDIHVGKFSSISWKLLLNMGHVQDHNYNNVGSYALTHFDWEAPAAFFPPKGTCKILIGNDVWAGRGCIFKCTNPEKPLVIGDGAVIASDSVVVKNVPPYAIVGGNPAQIIKYRFPQEIIDALLRIKWWDWSLDKIHDNFKYFNDIKKFISLHDK